jgi:lia operon protein LiaG
MFSNNKLTNFIIWVAMIGVICFIAGGSMLGSEFRKFKSTGIQGLSSQNILDEKSGGVIDGINEITIDTDSVGVRVISYDGNEVKAQLKGSADKNSLPELSINKASDKIQIKVASKHSLVFFGFMNLDFDVYIPAKYAQNLMVESSSGSIDLSSFSLSELQCTAQSGSLKVKDVTAKRIILDCSSGSINASNVKGSIVSKCHSGSTKLSDIESSDVDVSTTSGSIVLDGELGTIKAEAVSGSIKADIAKLAGDISMKNTSGSCRISLPSDAKFQIKANTTSGGIHCSFPVTGDTGDHYIDGNVNNGTTKITLKSVSGSISIN